MPFRFPQDENGYRKVFVLTDITGLIEWVDYLPVQAVTEVAASANRAEVDGFYEVNSLASSDGLLSGVDYVPVYIVSDRTEPWQTSPLGYIPMFAQAGSLGGGDGISAFTSFAVTPLTSSRNNQRGISVSDDGLRILWTDTTYNVWFLGVMSVANDPTTLDVIANATEKAEWLTNNSGFYVEPGVNGMIVQMPVGALNHGSWTDRTDAATMTDETSIAITGSSNQFKGVSMSADGLNVYISRTNATVDQHELTVAFDMSTFNATKIATKAFTPGTDFAVDATTGHQNYCDFNADGTLLYFGSQQLIHEFALSTAWDITSAVTTGKHIVVGGTITGIHVDRINGDAIWAAVGAQMYKFTERDAVEPARSTGDGYSPSGMIMASEESYATPDFGSFGLVWKDDGTEFIMHNTGASNRLEQWTCSVAWDVSSATLTNTEAETLTTPSDMYMNPAGTRLFEVDSNEVIWYDLSVAWDLSTATYIDTEALPSVTSHGIEFSDDGFTMILCTTSETLVTYTCSTAFDPSTKGSIVATENILSSVNDFSTAPNPDNICFSSNGKYMYMVVIGRYIYEWYLSTAWDITTAVVTGHKTWQQDSINGIFMRKDTGKTIYAIGSTKTITEHTFVE